jgi:predicted ABC-type ATPase
VIHAALDARPIIVALSGPNGAGKSTFYKAFLSETGLRFVNADDLSNQLRIDACAAAKVAGELRSELVKQHESFIFETVLSDPVGDKVSFLKTAATTGYNVVLCYIGISGPEVSDERVAMRVSQGGHNVARSKITARFPRTLANLKLAVRDLPLVLVFDNSDLNAPYRRVAEFEAGKGVFIAKPIPKWLAPLL